MTILRNAQPAWEAPDAVVSQIMKRATALKLCAMHLFAKIEVPGKRVRLTQRDPASGLATGVVSELYLCRLHVDYARQMSAINEDSIVEVAP